MNLLRLEIPDAKARADVEDNFRKTIGQLLGGAAVLIGTGFAYYQSQLAQQATHDQLKATYDQIDASKAQIISQQISKGFEQLGSDKIVLRLGGIYALEGVMNSSEQYHQPALEALCAFVRDNAKAKIDKEKTKGKGPEPRATDIQAALTVIVRRKAGPGKVDLSGADLTEANLTAARLSGARLTTADLTLAYLTNADLTNTNLSGARLIAADLSGTNVSQSQLDKACGSKGTMLPSELTLELCFT